MDNYFYPHQNPSPTFPHPSQIIDPMSNLGFHDYHSYDMGSHQDLSSQYIGNSENTNNGSQIMTDDAIFTSNNTDNHESDMRSNNEDRNGARVAIRTRSDLEIMDDGYKWRKYGKKMVKNSSNPRNYYKCSSGGCNVKKRVERDGEDTSYVITTYEGTHNHHSPSYDVAYYNSATNELPRAWSLQPSNY